MIMRRIVIVISVVLFSFILTSSKELSLQDKKKGTQSQTQSSKISKAIAKGLEWLSENYDYSKYKGGWNKQPEVVSIVLIAFTVNGYGPEDPKYGKKIQRWIDYVMQEHKTRRPDRAFLLGLGTMALAQVSVLTKDEQLKKKIYVWVESAAKRILKFQRTNEGKGWGYNLTDNKWMTFVSCWMIQALWSAKQMGVEIPQKSFDDGGTSLLTMFSDGRGGRGNFGYYKQFKIKHIGKIVERPEAKKPKQVKRPWSETPPKCTGDRLVNNTAGALGLMYGNMAKSKQADRTIRHIMEHTDLSSNYMHIPGHSMPSIGVFNGMQLVILSGKKYDWKKWRSEIEKQILAAQNDDGSFYLEELEDKHRIKSKFIKENKNRRFNPLSTALAAAALGIPNGNVIWLKGVK